VSDFGPILVGIAAIASVVVGYFKTKKLATEGQKQVAEVHILVNSKMSDALARIEALEKELAAAKELEK